MLHILVNSCESFDQKSKCKQFSIFKVLAIEVLCQEYQTECKYIERNGL